MGVVHRTLQHESLQKDRIGGRLFTHTFDHEQKPNPENPNLPKTLYYDVGAMRFPDIAIMKRYVLTWH